ncbi:MAG: FHA domain-containing protein, partial [Chloroflexales bacterium]|nr:FHA domain-containing protein [Chloroflexales bacterium]
MSTFFGMLIISYPDKHQEHVRLLREVVHIGRDPDANDIPLPYPQVHEQHLALFCSQAGISVMNVSGADSTWIERPGLARARLAAGRDIVSLTNETAVVLADASAREESTIRLEVRLAPGVMEAPDPRPALEALIRLELKPDAIVLEAGERQALTLVVTSAASQVQNIILELDGIPPSWFTLPPPIGLIPTGTNERGAQETTTITLHPPLSDRSTANTYSLQLLARSDTYDGGVTRPLLLTVLPYISFDLSIQPEKMAGWPHGMFEVQLTSGSNFPLPLSLSVEKAENALWPVVVPATAVGLVRRRRRVRVFG